MAGRPGDERQPYISENTRRLGMPFMSTTSSHSRPQLSLHELQQLQWLLGGVLALFSAWTVFYLDVEDWTVVALTTAGVAAALVWPNLPARVPTWVHRLAFPAISLLFLYDLWNTGQLLPAMVRLDLLLILYRGISYRARRDDLQLIVLGLFLVVMAGVITVSIAFAMQIVFFTACALALLFVVTLTDAAQAGVQRTPLPAPNVKPPWVAHLDWGRLLRRLREVADWRVLALGGALFAGVVVVTGLLFLAIPRFQLENSLLLDRFISKKARTGFSESIRFGDVTEIMQDNGLALSIDVSDPRQMPATPYLRMIVLDEYVPEGGFRLSAGLRSGGLSRERTLAQIRGSEPARRREPVSWTFYFEPGVSRYLPVPGAFELLRFREAQNLFFSPILQVVALRLEPAIMTAYQVENPSTAAVVPDPGFAASFAQVIKTTLEDANGARRRAGRLMLALPPGNADRVKLAYLVTDIAGAGSETPAARHLPAAEFARRASEWLARQHTYSLNSHTPSGAGDPLVRWLESGEPGHCELFAGALVLLARTAGYPARLVVGFKGGTWNGYSNNLTVRNSDAHAWVEIWNGEGGWLRVDPTPGAISVVGDSEPAGVSALDRRLDRSWSARLDSLRIFWYRRIVNFDQRSQLETLQAVKGATQQASLRMRAAVVRGLRWLQAWKAQPWDVWRIARVAAVVGALAGVVWAWRCFRVSWRWRWSGRGRRREDPVRREAGRWLRRIAESGKRRAESPRPRAESGDRKPESPDGPEIVGVTAELQRLRYGARATWPEPGAVFRRARLTAADLRRRR
jgi:protein-glutamine gamma-glutamyltransferase